MDVEAKVPEGGAELHPPMMTGVNLTRRGHSADSGLRRLVTEETRVTTEEGKSQQLRGDVYMLLTRLHEDGVSRSDFTPTPAGASHRLFSDRCLKSGQ